MKIKPTSEKAKSASKVSSRSHLGDTSCVPKLRFPHFTTPWETTPLSQLLRFQNGVNAPAEKYGRGVKFVSVSDIIQNDYVTYDNIVGCVDIDDATLERYSVENGDMVFQRSSETVEDIGRANVYLDNRTATFGGFVIRGKKIGVYNPYFFKCLLYSNEARRKVIRAGAGAQHYNIGQEALSQIYLHFPEMAEQRRIADLLLLVSNRIDAQRKLVELLKKHKRGLVQDLFTGELSKLPRRRFGGFKDAWISRSFDEVFSFLKNNTLPRSEMTTVGGIIRNVHYGDVLIKYGDVLDCNRNQIPFLVSDKQSDDCRLLQDGDVVIADTAEDEAVGKAVELVGVANKLIESGLHTIACRPKIPFASRFLGYYLNSTAYRRQLLPLMQGIKVLSLSKSQLGKTQLHFPSNINEQKRIAELLAGIDALIVVAELHLDKMQSLKTGLLQQLFV